MKVSQGIHSGSKTLGSERSQVRGMRVEVRETDSRPPLLQLQDGPFCNFFNSMMNCGIT